MKTCWLRCFSAELRASRESGTKWCSLSVGYRCCVFSFFFFFKFYFLLQREWTLLKDISFPHTLLVFFLCTIMWKWIMYSVLTFEDQIMKTILKNKILPNLSTVYSWGTSRVGIKLSTRMSLSLCSIVALFAVPCASFEITFWFHIIFWIWSWRN